MAIEFEVMRFLDRVFGMREMVGRLMMVRVLIELL